MANLPRASAAPVEQTEPEPKKPKGLPEAAPFRFAEAEAAGLDTSKLDTATLAEAVTRAKADFAAHRHPFGALVAHPAYPASGYLQGYSGSTDKVRVMFAEAESNPADSVTLDAADLFDPQLALAIYAALTAPAPASGAAAALVALALAFLCLFGNVACTPSTATAAVKAAPAKVGTVVKAFETPPVVQKEAQVLTAEIIQRAVDEKKQGVVAGWCSCISRGIMDLAGAADPSASDLQTAIEKEAGPQTDPEFPILVATAVDFWTITKAAIPAGSSAATVETYLYAAATGVQAGSVSYLPAATVAANWIVLNGKHEAYRAKARAAFLRSRQ